MPHVQSGVFSIIELLSETRELAGETQNSLATVSRVSDLLVREAIIVRDGPRGTHKLRGLGDAGPQMGNGLRLCEGLTP